MTTSLPKKACEETEEDWQYVSVTDLKQEDAFPGTCELCNRSGLRFLYLLEDCIGGETIEVGCCCGAKLITGFDGKRIERKLLSLRKKREEFPYRKSWKLSRRGNPRLVAKDYEVTIFPDNYEPDAFSYCVADRNDGETRFDSNFLSKEDAMLAAFDCLAELKGWTEP